RARERWHRSHDLNQMRDDIVGMLAESAGVMAAFELADAMLASRGSVENDAAERRRLAIAVLRGATELEAAMAAPRFRLHVEGQPPLIATHDELLIFARRLGKVADQLIGQEPLPSAERAGDELRQAGGELIPDRIR